MQPADFTRLSGTISCYPPEYFETKRYNGKELDFWGAALVLYEIVEGSSPFETADDIMNKPLSLRKSYSNSYKFFILGALDKKREKRFNFEMVWDHIWMR